MNIISERNGTRSSQRLGAHVASTEAAKTASRKWYQVHKEEVTEKRALDRSKARESARKYAASEKGQATVRTYRESHKTAIAARLKAYDAANPDKAKARQKKWDDANPEKMAQKWRRAGAKIRLTALKHYGGDPPSCACCGVQGVEFLALDHIGGGGNAHRKMLIETGQVKSTTATGKAFFTWIKNSGYPDGFRVLCHSCNMADGIYGECPHQHERLTVSTLHKTAMRLLGAL